MDNQSLTQVILFNGMQPAEIEAICGEAAVRKTEKGGYLFFQGDPAERLYLLLAGKVKLTQVNPDGQQVLLRAIGPYHLFGAVVLTPTEAYPVSAEAAEDCTALTWAKPRLMALVRRYPQLALNAIQLMATHTQELQERFRQLATERVERRLAHTLIRLASQTGKKTPEGVLIDLPLTRQDLAEMTGMTLFTVSRLLSQWESQGLISARREQIVIRFPHGLVSIAEG